MVDIHTFINHEGVDTYKAKHYLEHPSMEVRGINTADKDGNTPFMYVIKFTNPEIATWLLKMGADINAKNNAGETAMTFAVKRENPVLVNFLVERGVNDEAKELAKEFTIKYEQRKKEEQDLLDLEARERKMREDRKRILHIRLRNAKSKEDKKQIMKDYDEEHKVLKDQLEQVYEKRRQTQKAGKTRRTQKSKRTRQNKSRRAMILTKE